MEKVSTLNLRRYTQRIYNESGEVAIQEVAAQSFKRSQFKRSQREIIRVKEAMQNYFVF